MSNLLFNISKLKKSIPLSDYIIFAEAWSFIAIARLMLIFFPFKMIIPILGHTSPPKEKVPDQTFYIDLEKIKLAILRAASRSPWRARCFEQALAAKMMLKHRELESTIYFGVAKNDNPKRRLSAHAWLECCGMTITGEKNRQAFTIINSFRS